MSTTSSNRKARSNTYDQLSLFGDPTLASGMSTPKKCVSKPYLPNEIRTMIIFYAFDNVVKDSRLNIIARFTMNGFERLALVDHCSLRAVYIKLRPLLDTVIAGIDRVRAGYHQMLKPRPLSIDPNKVQLWREQFNCMVRLSRKAKMKQEAFEKVSRTAEGCALRHSIEEANEETTKAKLELLQDASL